MSTINLPMYVQELPTLILAITRDHPWLWWQLDDIDGTTNLVDSSGNGRTGTGLAADKNQPALMPGLGPSYGDAAAPITAPYALTPAFNDGDSFSYFVIVKLSALPAVTCIAHIGDNATAGEWGTALYVQADGSVLAQWFNGGYQSFGSAAGLVAVDVGVLLGLSYDGPSKTMKLYVNGTEVATQTLLAHPLCTGNTNVKFGSVTGGTPYRIQGYLQQATVFDYALPATRFALYAAICGV